jgi:hypothetical protein
MVTCAGGPAETQHAVHAILALIAKRQHARHHHFLAQWAFETDYLDHFETPADASELVVDRISGKRLPEGLALSESRIRKEWFVRGKVPALAAANDYDTEGRTRVPLTYATWWRDPSNPLKNDAFLEALAESMPVPDFRIVSPLEGTVAFIDPDLPESGMRFPLKVAGSGNEEIEWSSKSLAVESENGESWLVLKPGEHEVAALDRKSGRIVKSRLKVQAL